VKNIYLDIDGFLNLPSLNQQPHSITDNDHPAGLVIQEIQKYDKLKGNVDDNAIKKRHFFNINYKNKFSLQIVARRGKEDSRAKTHTIHILFVLPKLNIILKGQKVKNGM
jgi:hypothetical protein